MILSLYMASDPGTLVSGALRLTPTGKREWMEGFVRTLERRLKGWILGTGLAMLIVGVGAGMGLWLLGVPLPITFGLIAGLLNVIPYFGSIVGALLPIDVSLTISPLKALLVAILFFILNQIDGYLVQPLVMGHEVKLHPVLVLISFLTFGTLLGFAGLILAVPAAAVLVTLVEELERSRNQEHDASPPEAERP